MDKNKITYNIFGFADLINLNHLTDEEILQLEKMLEDYK